MKKRETLSETARHLARATRVAECVEQALLTNAVGAHSVGDIVAGLMMAIGAEIGRHNEMTDRDARDWLAEPATLAYLLAGLARGSRDRPHDTEPCNDLPEPPTNNGAREMRDDNHYDAIRATEGARSDDPQ